MMIDIQLSGGPLDGQWARVSPDITWFDHPDSTGTVLGTYTKVGTLRLRGSGPPRLSSPLLVRVSTYGLDSHQRYRVADCSTDRKREYPFAS